MPEKYPSTYIHNSHKQYPTGLQILVTFNSPIRITLNPDNPKKTRKFEIPSPFSKIRADKRAKTVVKDIVLSNKFELFCTFTFDKTKVSNRYDPDLCKMVMQRWLKSQARKYGTFEYVILPEFHKDRAIHFHALFGGYKGPLRDSGVKHDHQPVYNFQTFTYGFSSAKKINQSSTDYEKVASYLTKYITKDMPHFSGKKRYWSSANLLRPTKTTNYPTNLSLNHNDTHGQPRYIVRHN